MSAKLRTATKGRRPQFSREILTLFGACDRVPKRQRHGDQWHDASKRLAILLGLGQEWFCSHTVNDTDRSPPEHETFPCRDWAACREVRRQLLEAVREAEVPRSQTESKEPAVAEP
jgi:hypothetical protein